ncbi:hypothetical protein TNCV_944531 [Trichonephila clavipes]|nr:hypothetical protein TNCV_944531 [Trichonephila clavipes]
MGGADYSTEPQNFEVSFVECFFPLTEVGPQQGVCRKVPAPGGHWTHASEKQVGRIDVSAATSVGAICVVARCWQQGITEGRVYRRGGSGRPRNTNDREDRAIRRVATSAPTTSLASIQRHLPPSRHPVPSRETIRRRLTEVGLRSRRPLRRLPLTPTS